MVTKVMCRVGHPSADGQFCRHKKASVVLCIILACLFRSIVLLRDRSDCELCAARFRYQSHLLVEAAQEKISLTMITMRSRSLLLSRSFQWCGWSRQVNGIQFAAHVAALQTTSGLSACDAVYHPLSAHLLINTASQSSPSLHKAGSKVAEIVGSFGRDLRAGSIFNR